MFLDEEEDDGADAGEENPKDIPWSESSISPSSKSSSRGVKPDDEEEEAADAGLDGVDDCSIAFVIAATRSGDSTDTTHDETLSLASL